MNKIDVVIEPLKLEQVKCHLNEIGVKGITVSEESDFIMQNGHSENEPEFEVKENMLPKTRIEIIATNDQVDDILLMFTCVGMECGGLSITFRPDQQAKGVLEYEKN